MLRRLVQWSQPAFMLLAVIAIGWFLANQWPVLRSYPWRLNWGWLLTTVVLTLVSWTVEISLWRNLLATLGGNLTYWTAARLWFLSAIVRYVPGNVWQPLSLTLYSSRHGVAPAATITSIVLYQVVILLAIVPILVVYFVWIDTKSLAAHLVAGFPPLLLWLALVPLLLFLLRPRWLVQLINWGLARLHRPPLALRLTSGRLLLLLIAGLGNWLLWGTVFAAFTFAVAGDGLPVTRVTNIGVNRGGMAALLVTAFPIANVIGLLSFITPSGFGVREGAFYLLLTPQIAGSVVTVIALGSRVWSIGNELFFALLSLPFERAATARIVAAKLDADQPDMAGTAPLPDSLAAPDMRRETT